VYGMTYGMTPAAGAAALVARSHNPLVPIAGPWVQAGVGTRIEQIAPRETPGLMVKLNGEWILREHWDYPLRAGDKLELHQCAHGGDSRNVLRLVLMVAAAAFLGPGAFGLPGLGLTGLQLAGASLLANLAIGALVGVEAPNTSAGQTPSTAYSTSLSGNRPALDECIPVIFGTHKVQPRFAGDPYSEFGADDKQFFHAVYVVGEGPHNLLQPVLDDTDLRHFKQVQYEFLAPGEQPTLAQANIVTASEVSGQELLTGEYSPAIAACRGRQTATRVGIDIVFGRGLGEADSGGDFDDKSVTIRVEWRPVDDFGAPLVAWSALATETITAATSAPVRRSYWYTLPGGAARPEIRLVRTDTREDKNTVLNDPTWGGLRAELAQAAPLSATATHFAIRMQASEQLNGMTQRQVGLLVERLVRTWSPGGGWGALTATRNPAWHLADKWSNTVYGDALPDSRIDLAGLYALAQVCDARQDRCDIIFDTTMDSDSADQLIAGTMRARCFWRQGVRTVWRDGLQSLPEHAYGARDMLPGSFEQVYVHDKSNVPEGIVLEYMDHRSWRWESIDCPAPGFTVRDATDPRYDALLPSMARFEIVKRPGITGATQAEREGLYEAAKRFYRRRACTFSTELQGQLVTFGQPVALAPALRGWAQNGDVTHWDLGTLTAGLSEPPAWVDGERHFIAFVKADGALTEQIECRPGPSEWDVVLDVAPSDEPVVDDGTRERTRFLLGPTRTMQRFGLVTAMEPQELTDDHGLRVGMAVVLDDERVHQADNHLLAGPGDDQDPITEPGVPEDPGAALIVNMNGRTVTSTASAFDGMDPASAITLRNNGGLRASARLYDVSDALTADVITDVANEWVYGWPIELADASLYEVRATLVLNGLASFFTLTGTFDTWLPLSSDQSWEYQTETEGGGVAQIRFEVREVSTGIVQDTADIVLQTNKEPAGGGA
jgi:hypothetical protein